MAFNFVQGFKKQLDSRIDAMMTQLGTAGVAEAQRLVHVETGQTRDSIGFTYNQATKTLQLYADTAWAIYLEFKYPYLRPALLSLRGFRLNSANFEIGFQSKAGVVPGHLSKASEKVNRGIIKRTKVRVRRYDPHRPLS